MKHIASLILSLAALPSFAWTQRPNLPIEQCVVHAPYGMAITQNVTPLCRQGYLSGYDASAKIPKYVAYTLLPQNAIGCIPRTNAFTSDDGVIKSPTPNDYAGTGFDKGHLVPDGDLSWDVQVEYESFLMTNMAPQAPSLNRGIWKLLETSVRGWSVQLNQSFTIYAGGVYGLDDKMIGSGVKVPNGYYKIVINNQTKEVAGWAFPHVAPYPNLGNDLTKFRLPIAQIEKSSKVNFKFPRGAKELDPGKEWPVNFGAFTDAKRKKCGANVNND